MGRSGKSRNLVRLIGKHGLLRVGLHFPQFDRPVFGSGYQSLSVAREGECGDGTFMSITSELERIDFGLRKRQKAPDANPIICSTSQHGSSIGTEEHDVLFRLRLAKRIESLTVRDSPQFHCLVAAGAGQNRAIGMKCQVVDRPVVTFERTDRLSAGDLPDQDFLVIAARYWPSGLNSASNSTSRCP